MKLIVTLLVILTFLFNAEACSIADNCTQDCGKVIRCIRKANACYCDISNPIQELLHLAKEVTEEIGVLNRQKDIESAITATITTIADEQAIQMLAKYERTTYTPCLQFCPGGQCCYDQGGLTQCCVAGYHCVAPGQFCQGYCCARN